jgi:hypothetical protein
VSDAPAPASGKDIVATGVFCGLLAFALGHGHGHAARERPPSSLIHASGAGRLSGKDASFAIQPSLARVTAKSRDNSVSIPMDMHIVVDGATRPIPLARLEQLTAGVVGGTFRLDLEDGRTDVTLAFHLDGPSGALLCELTADDGTLASKHDLALEATLATERKPVFLSGIGEIADVAHVSGAVAVIEDDAHPVGVVSSHGPIEVHRSVDLAFRSKAVNFGGATDLRILLAPNTQGIWQTLFGLAAIKVAPVRGVVTGARERAIVFGLDADGTPQVRARTDESGVFELSVPPSVTKWYAALDAARTSAPVLFEPGTPWDLKLDISPGGELHVRIVDPDSGRPITARLIVHGIDGTLDPSFGPDYRASGAGPIVDALRGEVVTPLPAGRYRVSATKGIEWSVDSKTIELTGGHSITLELAPRHVVPTPGVLGADLHVHARPSFDTPVSTEDRVLSLLASGIEFAVPTEHNVVGDYTPTIDAMAIGQEFSTVSGVEITTFSPSIGHFGLFPYPVDARVPLFRRSSWANIFFAAHKGDPNRILQINHPRLPKKIGYFEIAGFDPKAKGPPARMRTDFDAIEVYNGYEMQSPARVEMVLRDWFALLNQGHHYAATGSSDSHSIQYQWAGYPRTLIRVGPQADGDLTKLDTGVVVSNLKQGRATVTTGPIIEVEAEGARPGDELTRGDFPVVEGLRAHVAVRAAPWVDVSSVEIVADGERLSQFELPVHPTKVGVEPGTREEAAARTLRYEGDVSIPWPNDGRRHWFVVVARGTKKLDEVLPFMPVAPMAMTNPIWLLATGPRSQK